MKRKYFNSVCWIVFFVITILIGCESQKKAPVEKQLSENAIHGKQLAEKYCVSCHVKPDPSLLDKENWRRVMPIMQREMDRRSMKIFYMDWIALENYYEEAAPSKLPKFDSSNVMNVTNQFKEEDERIRLPQDLDRNLTLVKYLQGSQIFFLGNEQGEVFRIGEKGGIQKVMINNIPIDADFLSNENSILVLGIGDIYPSQEKKGALIKIDSMGNSCILIDSLSRPVQFCMSDFNNDEQDDFLIASFGAPGETYTGKLSLYTDSMGIFTEHVVKNLPGALKTITGDFNGDSKTDIIALFSQGREMITLFLNKGNFEFEENRIAEFPPVYGTNNFVLADINKDGSPDIVCTNGDNGDYSPVFKNYHGVRILINDGRYNFKERYFFPINGASGIVAEDFDKDDDIDLVVLSSYPNLIDRPQESLVYFENRGDVTFTPSCLERKPSGKWLLMTSADPDHDGYPDLIVGANRMEAIKQPSSYEQRWNEKKKSVVVFKNMNKNSTSSRWKSLWD